jgi:hypothetical protein
MARTETPANGLNVHSIVFQDDRPTDRTQPVTVQKIQNGAFTRSSESLFTEARRRGILRTSHCFEILGRSYTGCCIVAPSRSRYASGQEVVRTEN